MDVQQFIDSHPFSRFQKQLLALRFLTGLGLGGAMPCAITLTSEYCPQPRRAGLLTMMFCGFTLGSAFGGLIAAQLLASTGWRGVLLIGGILPLLLLPVLCMALPESLRWMVHPLNNLRVLKYLSEQFQVTPEQKNAWYRHWVALGLRGLEQQLARDSATGAFCHGDTPTMADCCLLPQLNNARRFDCDLSPYPTLTRIGANCEALPAFRDAAPDRQRDAE
jgi:hypothetical protein